MKIDVCSDTFADSPKGIPQWCVNTTFTWIDGLQLVGELIILCFLAYASHRFGKYWKTKQGHKRRLKEESDIAKP